MFVLVLHIISNHCYLVVGHKRIKINGYGVLSIAVGLLDTVYLHQFLEGKTGENDAPIWLATDWQCLLVRVDQQDSSLCLTDATVAVVKVSVSNKSFSKN